MHHRWQIKVKSCIVCRQINQVIGDLQDKEAPPAQGPRRSRWWCSFARVRHIFDASIRTNPPLSEQIEGNMWQGFPLHLLGPSWLPLKYLVLLFNMLCIWPRTGSGHFLVTYNYLFTFTLRLDSIPPKTQRLQRKTTQQLLALNVNDKDIVRFDILYSRQNSGTNHLKSKEEEYKHKPYKALLARVQALTLDRKWGPSPDKHCPVSSSFLTTISTSAMAVFWSLIQLEVRISL